MKSLIRQKVKKLKKPLSSLDETMLLAEKRHIQAHLAIMELRLRLPWKNNAHPGRLQALDILNAYWKKGVFPRNTYDATMRKPVFVDSQGTYCAVGHLMAQTGYKDLVQDIDRTDKFVLVDVLNDNRVAAWLNQYGFMKSEASGVQPGYAAFVAQPIHYTMLDKSMAQIAIVVNVALLVVADALARGLTLVNRARLQPSSKEAKA